MNDITVVIPLYNREGLIRFTLKSLLNQSDKEWKCIIVDDNSTDKSVEVTKSIIGTDNRFSLHCKNINSGVASSRNIGWNLADTSHVMFLDSDDLLANFAIEKRKAFIKNNPDYDCWIFNTEFFRNEPGDWKEARTYFKFDNQDLLRFIGTGGAWHTSSPVYKNTLLKALKGFDENLKVADDTDIAVRLLAGNFNYVKNDSQPDSFVRINSFTTGGRSLNHSVTDLKRVNENYYLYKKWKDLTSGLSLPTDSAFKNKLITDSFNSLYYGEKRMAEKLRKDLFKNYGLTFGQKLLYDLIYILYLTNLHKKKGFYRIRSIISKKLYTTF